MTVVVGLAVLPGIILLCISFIGAMNCGRYSYCDGSDHCAGCGHCVLCVGIGDSADFSACVVYCYCCICGDSGMCIECVGV